MNDTRRLPGRFLSLSRQEKTLLFQAASLLPAIRLALTVLPFETVRRVLARLAAPRAAVRTSERERDNAGRLRAVWAVETVGRRFPAVGTCLTQALAAHVLMGRMGHKSDLRIGVTRNAGGTFTAHAWLEDEGTVLIGGACHTGYTPMPVLNGLDPRVSPSEPRN